MKPRHVLAMVTLLAVLVTTYSPSEAKRRSYSVTTSVPEGRAVCIFNAAVEDAKGRNLKLRVKPEAGDEATVTLIPLILGAESLDVAAGVETACDIFVNAPVQATMPITNALTRYLGIVQIHAHPGLDCGASKLGTGNVFLNIVRPNEGDTLTFSPLTCSGNVQDASIIAFIDGVRRAQTGQRLRFSAVLRNLGPGNASNGKFRVRIPNGFLLDTGTYATTLGACKLVTTTGGPLATQVPCDDDDGACLESFGSPLIATDFICDLDDMLVDAEGVVAFDLIPVKTGTLTTTYRTDAANSPDIVPPIDLQTQVQQGSSAVLRVKVKARGTASGTVTISPPGTVCTAPDPANPATKSTQCIEIYGSQTTVTLTANATTGSFAGWEDDCASFGTAATCTLVVDPNATPPDKTAKAKFVP